MSRVLVAGFTASTAYLCYRVYSHWFATPPPPAAPSTDAPDMERVKAASVEQRTPFPPHLELYRTRPPQEQFRTGTLCDGLRRELQSDWNRLLHVVSEQVSRL